MERKVPKTPLRGTHFEMRAKKGFLEELKHNGE